MEFYRFNPSFFADLTWDFPESDNPIPDILDEAKWGIDIWKRLQTEEGGIPGWIESITHPRPGEYSWVDSLDLYMTVPDEQSSFHYAAAAARFASVMPPLDSAAADECPASAVKAFDFAESRFTKVRESEFIRMNILGPAESGCLGTVQ